MLNARITGLDEKASPAVTGLGKLLQLLETSEKVTSPGSAGTTESAVFPFAQLLQGALQGLASPQEPGAALRRGAAEPRGSEEELPVIASSEERLAVASSSSATTIAAEQEMSVLGSPGEEETIAKRDEILPQTGEGDAKGAIPAKVGIQNYAGFWPPLGTRNDGQPGMTNLLGSKPSWIASPGGDEAALRSVNAVPESPKGERTVSAPTEERGAVTGSSEAPAIAWLEKLAFSASPEEQAAILKRDEVLLPGGKGEARAVLSSQGEIRNDVGMRSLLRTRDAALPGMTNLPEPTPSWVASPGGEEAALRSVNAVPESLKGEGLISVPPPEERRAVLNMATAKAWPEMMTFHASPAEEKASVKRDDVLLPGGKGEARAVLSGQVEILHDAGLRSLLLSRDDGQPCMTNLSGPKFSGVASPGGDEAVLKSGNAVPESPKGEGPISAPPEERGAVPGANKAMARAWPEKMTLNASPAEEEASVKRDDVLLPGGKGEARAVLSSQGEILNNAGLRSFLLPRDAALPGMTNLPEPTSSWIASTEGDEAALRSVNAVPESPKGEVPVIAAQGQRGAARAKSVEVLPQGASEAIGIIAAQGKHGPMAKGGDAFPKEMPWEQREHEGTAGKVSGALSQGGTEQTVAMANREAQEEAAANTTGLFLQAEQNNGRKVTDYSFIDAPAHAERVARNMGKVLSGREEQVLSDRLSSDEPEKMQKIMAEIPQGHGAEDGELSASGKPLKQPDAPRELSPRERNIPPSEAALSSPGPREAISSGDGTSLENMEAREKIPGSLPHVELEPPRDDGRRDKGLSINKGKPTFKEVFTLTNQNDLHLTMGNTVVEKEQKISFFPQESFLEEVAGFLPQAAMKGAGRIKITITPPHLGSLEMEVLVRDNKVQVIMMADSRDVQQTLQVNSEQLKQALQQHGMSVGRFDVLWQGEQSGQRSDYGGGNAFGHNMEHGRDRGKAQENDVATLVTASYGKSKNPLEGSVGISLFA